MVRVLQRLHHDSAVKRCFAVAGGPWEFNLRDLLRWCHLAEAAVPAPPTGSAPDAQAAALDAAVRHFVRMLFVERLRTAQDREHAAAVVAEFWPEPAGQQAAGRPDFHITPTALQIGWASLERQGSNDLAKNKDVAGALVLRNSQISVLESMAGG